MFVTKQIAAKMPRTIVHSSSIWIWRNKASYQSICYPIELTLHEGNGGKERSYPRQKWERTEFPIWPLNSTWLMKSIHTYIHWHLFASVSTGVDRVIWLPLKHAVLSWPWESLCRKAFYSFWSFPLSSPTIPQKHTHTRQRALYSPREAPVPVQGPTLYFSHVYTTCSSLSVMILNHPWAFFTRSNPILGLPGQCISVW